MVINEVMITSQSIQNQTGVLFLLRPIVISIISICVLQTGVLHY